ncbi:variant erythrocyte surface antigen-1 family protein [Babesia caballi]|uniref:Variant erythrocyte surface antigen-1 family protein n=1 Tax=Babesia caballi TaxID=5871 RepID=A0AAV4LPN2_BABCB|nr:variant erythrocyte surface antigen-1 family protein [Babesia caballi]
MSGNLGKQLTDSPSNLKEAIDWILRVTGKDGQSGTVGGSGHGTQALATAVGQLLGDVESSSHELKEAFGKIKEALSPNPSGLIDNLADGLAKFIGYENGSGNIGNGGIAVGQNGEIGKPHESRDVAKEFKYGLATYKDGYIWSYPRGADWNRDFSRPVTDHSKAAKIFLGCVPMLLYGLGLLYWRCRESGEWNSLKLKETGISGNELCYFLSSQGFVRTELRSQTLKSVLNTAFKGFDELSSAVIGSNSIIGFLNNLHSNLKHTLRTTVSKNLSDIFKTSSISVLFLVSSAYFTHHRQKSTQSHPPSSIRQMLYWLSGLTMTPQFGDLLNHFVTVVPDDFNVAVSGSSKQKEKLTADDLMGHLITSCLSSSWVLGTIQGSGGSEKPLLHEIFSNTEDLKYAYVASSLFYTLSSYTYALQFQLTFLVRQCRFSYDDACGWQQCKYGGSYTRGVTVHSYLCPSNGNGCDNTNSPLQAFLTDNLKGFSRNIPGNAGHLATCSGSYCHTPMGFNGHLRSDKKTGENIYDNLSYFCGDSKDPLRQLGEKLYCLTKRTPRILGEMFGFLTQLTGQAFSDSKVQSSLRLAVSSSTQASKSIKEFIPSLSTPSSLLSNSISTLTNTVTFWETLDGYFAASSLASGLYNLNQHCHKVQTDSDWGVKTTHEANGCSNPTDLFSLYIMVNDKKTPDCASKHCGPYLNPLCYSTGATFSPNYSPTYLSWLLYLHDDFYDWLHNMLDDLINVKCLSISGGTHAAGCLCPSVVQCSEVLPHLYSRGFDFYSASWLKYKKVTCQKFHDRLKAVAEGKPINDLLTIIDEFLYIFRYSFLHKVSAFWTIYTCLIMYTFFFLLDTLHLRSHLKLTVSHVVPPVSLLTSGQPLPVTKLTYLVS